MNPYHNLPANQIDRCILRLNHTRNWSLGFMARVTGLTLAELINRRTRLYVNGWAMRYDDKQATRTRRIV
jgi:hypothetical protein